MNSVKSPDLEKQARTEVCYQKLRAAVIDRGYPLTADERVTENDAAELLGYVAGSLKNLRTLGVSPPFYRKPVGGCRISYRLTDLAEWIESAREDY